MPPTNKQLTYRLLAGAACLLAGIGMIRYAYAPLLPSMFHHKWLDPAAAGYVGGASFAGNFIGSTLFAVVFLLVPLPAAEDSHG